MAEFDFTFAHDVLLPIAAAAYLPSLTANSLPPGYSMVGPLKVNPLHAAALMAAGSTITPRDFAMVQQMRRTGDGFGWVVQNVQDRIVAISFRGTDSLEDWLDNLDFLPSPYEFVADFGAVHRGFQSVYKVVRDSMFAQLRNADAKFTRLIVTGHSLGAALSELAAPDLLHNSGSHAVPEVQNFAGPRAGHHDFSSIFDAQIDTCFRVVNAWDIVPQLPPPLTLFEHVGSAVRVDGGLTLDMRQAHSLQQSYAPGLAKFMPVVNTQRPAASTADLYAENEMLIGREP